MSGQHVKPPAALKPPKIGVIEEYRCERCGRWVPLESRERCPKAK